ncbi:MAG TPA: helix-turn-helix domain-containing protein [Thermomicrobiales bacterium]|jgi:DNA-directed RNA polymerase specialized sigma24 family protein
MTRTITHRTSTSAHFATPPSPLTTHDSRLTTLPWDFNLTPAIEAHLDALARAGRVDPAARNELHRLLSGKIARFLAPWRGQELAIGDFADLCQESFLVFAALVTGWPGTGSFARYFLGFFPWRLRHALEAHKRRWPTERLVIIPERDLLDSLLTEDDPHDPLLPFWPLTADDRLLLALRLLGGYSVAEIAQLLGWSRRTTFRRWRTLTDRLTAPDAATQARAS